MYAVETYSVCEYWFYLGYLILQLFSQMLVTTLVEKMLPGHTLLLKYIELSPCTCSDMGREHQCVRFS